MSHPSGRLHRSGKVAAVTSEMASSDLARATAICDMEILKAPQLKPPSAGGSEEQFHAFHSASGLTPEQELELFPAPCARNHNVRSRRAALDPLVEFGYITQGPIAQGAFSQERTFPYLDYPLIGLGLTG